MARQVPARNGGTLTRPDKGETMNPNGRPKVPRKLKDFIKEMETENAELLFPIEAMEIVERKGKKYYRLQNSRGSKMFMTAYNRAIKGDVRWADFLVKMGFAGGYEPVKNENKTSLTTESEEIQELRNLLISTNPSKKPES